MFGHHLRRTGAVWCTVVLLLSLGACGPREPLPPLPGPYPLIVPQAPVPFQARGALLIDNGDDTVSGTMTVEADAAGAVRLRLMARVTGAVLLDVRMTPERLLVLDHAERVYYSGDNSPRYRLAWLRFDMTPAELVSILAARVTEARYRASDGRLGRSGLTLREGDAWHRITLAADGRPVSWEKHRGSRLLYRVNYDSYLATNGEPSTTWPRRLRVLGDAGADAPPTRIVMGFSEVRLGGDLSVPMDFDPPADWQPGAEPERESLPVYPAQPGG